MASAMLFGTGTLAAPEAAAPPAPPPTEGGGLVGAGPKANVLVVYPHSLSS